jgi:hypothetical protein
MRNIKITCDVRGSVLCSQEPVFGPYSELVEFNAHPYNLQVFLLIYAEVHKEIYN